MSSTVFTVCLTFFNCTLQRYKEYLIYASVFQIILKKVCFSQYWKKSRNSSGLLRQQRTSIVFYYSTVTKPLLIRSARKASGL